MRHRNTLFHDLLQLVPWHRFERHVDVFGSDTRVRRLSSKSQFIALLHAQLTGAESLREIETTLQSQKARLYHLGARPPARSTLADANARRSPGLFAAVFDDLLKQARPGLRRTAREAAYLIDATTVELNGLSKIWAQDKKRDGAAAKMHIVYDRARGVPVHFDVSPVRTNEIAIAKAMLIEPGATYVFDMGYYDFGWWAEMHALDCRFVTRLKRHTKADEIVETRAVVSGGPIKSDRLIRLTKRMKASRQNPLRDITLREIEVVIETGRTLRLVSNDLTSSATDIAELYKARWQIELFFKWVKQNLKIRRFLGTSENAVRTQIAIALIAFLLLRLAFETQAAITNLLAFCRLIRANLMHFRTIDQLHHPPPPDRLNPNQKEFALC